MMQAQGLRLFYNRGLHLLLARPAVSGAALTSSRAQFFSVVNSEMVFFSILIFTERFLNWKKEQGWQKVFSWCLIRR
jgi:hypothetical protein